MSYPLVSVIIPCLNAEQYICDCINSIVNQTYKNLEIIVVDNGSSDRTLELLQKYVIDRSGRKMVVVEERVRGAAIARNTGLDKAEGEYIQFFDADDVMEKNKIAKQVKVLQARIESVAVCSWSSFFEAPGKNPAVECADFFEITSVEYLYRYLSYGQIWCTA